MKNVQETGKVLDIKDFLKYSDVYVETGTCHGASLIRALRAGFKDMRTVEVYEPFYDRCEKEFKYHPNIRLWFGKSYEWLPYMLEPVNKPAVIFLDAHPAGPNTGGHDDFIAKGKESEFDQDNIIRKELIEILAHHNDHVIIIDDQNGDNPDNHETIEHYIGMLLAANPNYKFYFYDEQMGELFTKNKSLVCIPE